jgi:hypothetical protein
MRLVLHNAVVGIILVPFYSNKTGFMNPTNHTEAKDQLDLKDTRTEKYDEANDRLTEMTDQQQVSEKLAGKGFTEQFRVEKGRLIAVGSRKMYKSKDVHAVNFYRFEGISNPDDMSVLYAIETCDGTKGTLTDAYGLYADEATGDFMKQVEIEKKIKKGDL